MAETKVDDDKPATPINDEQIDHLVKMVQVAERMAPLLNIPVSESLRFVLKSYQVMQTVMSAPDTARFDAFASLLKKTKH